MDVHWLLPEDVIECNKEALTLTPGEPFGVRDHTLIESAIARGNMVRYYVPASDIFDMVAAIGYGLAKNHPFLNANKRTAFQVCVILLLLNGYWLAVDTKSSVAMFEGLARNNKTETCLAAWLRANSSFLEEF